MDGNQQPTYVELHLHSAYSFLDGASQAHELIARAKELGYQALAITDHDGLHGALEFARCAREAGIRPITGAEITLIDGSHLTLLAETQQGYRNLCRLITASYRTVRTNTPAWLPENEAAQWADTQGDDDSPGHYRDPENAPWIDPALLKRYAKGLILLTGCRHGRLAQLVDADQPAEAEAQLRDYIDWFGPNHVVVELQQNYVHGDTRRIDRLVKLAKRAGVPYVATGNVHYHIQERHRLQDVLVAIRHRSTLDGSHRQRRPNSGFHLVSPEEMAHRFSRYPEAIAASAAIAERCAAFDLNNDLGYTFPGYSTDLDETDDEALARICAPVLDYRYPPDSPDRLKAEERLADELRIIKIRGLAGFFLIHYDLLELAREVAVEIRGVDTARDRSNLPPGRGRGSSVSSLVCYLIGLSPVDPLKHKLSVGRFLNEEVTSVPDIDLDFPRDIRERLIARIHEDYGDRAAMVCAFATYRLRSAVRDVGKALGLPTADLDRISKLSEPGNAAQLGEELSRIPAYAAKKDVPPWSYLIELARQLAGFPRHITQHSGGIIVSSRPITDMTPVQPAAMEGRFLCQWDKDSCDDAGFVKIDFLALGMLSLVEESMILIAEQDPEGRPPDLSTIDFEDKAVYKMIQEGDTIGTFQIESRAQIQTVLRTMPENLNDLTVQVAIVRPGPIVGGATTPYIQRRKQENYQPIYDHPCLKGVLEETYGVILYQEQVIDVAVTMAGFTRGQADGLRKAMTRKRSLDEMMKHKEAFIRGAWETHGASAEIAETVFAKLLGFSSYGFPKGHAASFAVLAYQSCWLKKYHATEFLCALLNNQPMGFYPPHMIINDAKRRGLRIMKPDVNISVARCHVERHPGKAVRLGLALIKGLSEDEANAIVQERKHRGDFRSLSDFVRRVPLRMDVIENMIAIGAFDAFGLSRREALWQVGLFIPTKQFGKSRIKKEDARTKGVQISLPLPVDQDAVALPSTSAWERMAADYRVLGMSPHYHPLGLLRSRLPEQYITSRDLERLPHGALIRIAGLVIVRQRPGTAKGVTFLLIEDEFGLANIVVYRNLYEAQRNLVRNEPFVVITGVIQREDRNLNIIAHHFERLDPRHQQALTQQTGVKRFIQQDGEEIVDAELSPAAHNYR